MGRSTAVVAAAAALAASLLTGPPAAAATDPGLPSHSTIVSSAKAAADYYRPTYATTTLTPRNGWSWSTYFEGIQSLYQHAGDARYLADGMAWGSSNSWHLTTSETNPDTIKAGQVYHALQAVDPAASLAAMDSRMAADLTGLALSRYDWIDALFMGLPDWALWSARTGRSSYLDKMDAFYAWTRDSGATSSRCSATPSQRGLFVAATGLWLRDCSFVGATDTNGKPVYWSRGNGWVIAAMADVLRALPAGSPRAATYVGMLRTMAAALAPLQGADGLWRASLLDPALHPQPETSGTALITYALAYGVRSGALDAATYGPVVNRAWNGLVSTALQPSGFLSGCQGPGIAPAAPYTGTAPRTPRSEASSGTVNADSPPFCVGAFLMAAAQVAQLNPDLAMGRTVTTTAQQAGNEAPRAVDGDVTTRWSASPFPQAITVDLGSTRTIASTMVVPYQDRAYRYRVESSTDRATWRVLVDRSDNTRTGSQLDDFAAAPARYVRLTVLGVVGVSTTWASIQEFTVHAPGSGATSAPYARDTFTRATSNGLGAADTGGAWQVSGAPSAYSVADGTGRLRLAAPGTALSAFLGSVPNADVDLTVDSALDRSATGGGTYVAIAARHSGASDYRAKVRRASGGTVTLTLARLVSGVETPLTSQTIAGLMAAATDHLRIRLRVTGSGPTTLRGRVWRATSSEPTAWQVTTTDTTAALQRAGGVGLWAYLSSSATNSPVTASFDDLMAAAAID